MEGDDIAVSRGSCKKEIAAHAHAKFARLCGPKTTILSVAELEMAENNGSLQLDSLATDHASIDRPCAD